LREASGEPGLRRPLDIRRDGDVDWLTLNRPEKLNALDDALVAELLHYFLELQDRPSPRIIVISGAGRAFCAGLDLSEMQADEARTIPSLIARQKAVSDLILAMRRAPQPIVSLVHGAACGGGFAIALASDIRLAGASARMNAAFVHVGLSGCDVGLSYLLPRLVGASLAAELMLTGAMLDADRALAAGLVSRIVADGDLRAAAMPLVTAMLAVSDLGLRMTKEGLRMGLDAPSLDAAIALENRTQVLCAATSGRFDRRNS
jgi:enoyl-CoA hydratase/carnithine racemase